MDLSSLRYSQTHEWVHWDGNVATIGITDFAVSQLTDLVYVDLPKVGSEIKAGETCGEIESVKAVGELNSPLDGTVAEVNESLENELEKLSDSPFEAGWIFRLTPSDPSQIDALLDRAAYEKLCDEEGH
ncbi:glycine cleavage system protein GcvH [Rubinisphaera margarita]|uniref:glycine cleavage system protein GcvH n=1 Tax=Rubinisphaera margarita TaxID=2909586 RepID=UPI001EE7F22C|nr:glycine cleavage system protein GcvH [Rubinisphaera margarita]MCG6155146.1 glycine cleavage system protein GcvH [Rubinisphaera margarita]